MAIDREGFDAIAGALIPLKDEERAEALHENFTFYYNDLDADSQGKISLLFKVIKILAVVLKRKSLLKMSIDERQSFFLSLQKFPVKKIVAGFTGLRSLILVAYYTLEPVWQELSYKGPIVKRPL